MSVVIEALYAYDEQKYVTYHLLLHEHLTDTVIASWNMSISLDPPHQKPCSPTSMLTLSLDHLSYTSPICLLQRP